VTGAEGMMHFVTLEDCITFSDQKVSAKCKERFKNVVFYVGKTLSLYLASSNFHKVAM